MSNETYTTIGTLDLSNHIINLDIALPNPPARDNFEIKFYNFSKSCGYNDSTINAVLCEFTYYGETGIPLSTPTDDNYKISLNYVTQIPKPSDIPDVTDFDFSTNPECFILFNHNENPTTSDRLFLFEQLDKMCLGALKSSFVLTTLPFPGKPKRLGVSIIHK